MPNYCSSKYAFFANDENIGELKRLHDCLTDTIAVLSQVKNDFEPGCLGKVAIEHGIDPKCIPCRGGINYLSNFEAESGYFTLDTETAWAPMDELWEAVISRYSGISYVYIAEEPGLEVYINTDVEGTFFTERYLFEICGYTPVPEGWCVDDEKLDYLEIRKYFKDFDELADYCTKLTGKEFGTFEELKSYFFDILGKDCIHEFAK